MEMNFRSKYAKAVKTHGKMQGIDDDFREKFRPVGRVGAVVIIQADWILVRRTFIFQSALNTTIRTSSVYAYIHD